MTAWEIVSDVLRLLKSHTRPGIDALTLNNLADQRVRELGGYCYDLYYHPEWAPSAFPASLCISINNEIAHGIPSKEKILKEGDLVNFDIGVLKDGVAGDAALTVPVGEISQMDKKLLKATKKALYAGISKVKNGATVRDVAKAIERTARQQGFVVNRSFAGHGIGEKMHEDPIIYHCLNWRLATQQEYGEYEQFLNVKFQTGQKICLEPMLTLRDAHGTRQPDGWTFITRDGNKSAMFEHMLEVTDTGCNILTTHID